MTRPAFTWVDPYYPTTPWTPTEEAFQKYLARDMELARENVRISDETLHNPFTQARARAELKGRK